jgi:hypothetical protein
MTLSEFIHEKGDAQCSALFGVPVRTVAAWRRGECLPTRNQIVRLIEASDGALDANGIYASKKILRQSGPRKARTASSMSDAGMHKQFSKGEMT